MNDEPARASFATVAAFGAIAKSRAERWRRSARRAAARGLTLIEILVVLAIVAIITAGVLGGSGQLEGARLKQGATLVASAVRAGYGRASATSKSVRLVFDFEKDSMWLEEADQPHLVQSGDKAGTGGADPVTAAEKAALAESDRIIKGPHAPRSSFHPVTRAELGDPSAEKSMRPLPRGITFREIQAAHDTDPHKTGRAYLYFWPGGLTERAVIQVAPKPKTEERIFSDDKTLSLEVSPLTGKAVLKAGSIALKIPRDDDEASEREDHSL
jgi:general secretion pathway protein H